MSATGYVYIVLSIEWCKPPNIPEHAFTRKYDLINWLKAYEPRQRLCQVWRVRAGYSAYYQGHRPVRLDMEELLK